MSFGCVVVASNIKNNKELIDNKFNGLLFDFEENLENIVQDLLLNDETTMSLGQNSLNTVNEKNKIEKIADLDIEDYKKLTR